MVDHRFPSWGQSMVFDRNNPSVFHQFTEARADYDAMRESNYVRTRPGLVPNGGASDYHIRNETQYFKLIEKARDLCRNASIVDKSIEKAATNVVGDGLTLCPETGDSDVDALLFRKWQQWSTDPEQCDIAGEKTWSEMEELAVIANIRDGDIIGLGTKNGSLQLIESHQCRNPKGTSKSKNMVIGVELDEVRKRKRYHIRKEEIDQNKTAQSMESVPYDVRGENGMRQIFHFFVAKRSSETRGVTALAPCFTKLSMFDDLDFAKLVQAQAVSCIVLQKTKEATRPTLPTKSAALGSQSSETNSDGTTSTITQVAPGTNIENNPGEKIEAFTADVPNTNYFEHAKMLLTMFFLNIGLPYVMGMMDASESNFSGWRAATDEAKKGFKRIQRQLRDKWHKPIYIWKVRQWIAEDPEVQAAYLKVGDKIFNHFWRLPKWPYIQPVEDSAAQAFRVKNCLTSPRRLHGELSQDWEEIADETIADNAYAIRLAIREAKKINEEEKPDQPIIWREVLNLPTPEGMTLAIQAGGGGQSQPMNGGKSNGAA
jgi:lambda family phage portal protein